MILKWIEVGGVSEFSVVILGVEVGLGSLCDLDEVGDVLSVREVLVQVILEVLKGVHVLLHKVVSSNSGERESTVVQLPGVHLDMGVLALLLKLVVDFESIGVVLHVQSPAQIVELDVKLLLGHVQSGLARRQLDVGLQEGVDSLANLIILSDLNSLRETQQTSKC